VEEVVERVGHDAALADFKVNERVVVDVVETHFVRDSKAALHDTHSCSLQVTQGRSRSLDASLVVHCRPK